MEKKSSICTLWSDFFFFFPFLFLPLYQDARKLGLKIHRQKPFHFILLLKTHLWFPITSRTKSQLLSASAKAFFL